MPHEKHRGGTSPAAETFASSPSVSSGSPHVKRRKKPAAINAVVAVRRIISRLSTLGGGLAGAVGTDALRSARATTMTHFLSRRRRQLVPAHDDLTGDERKHVEHLFAQFGPIQSAHQLTDFLAEVGEQLSEEVLLALLLEMVDANRVDGSLTSRSALRQSLLQRNGRQAAALPQLITSDENAVERIGAPIKSSEVVQHVTTNTKLSEVLSMHFLAPFMSLEDVLELLHLIKQMVCENRVTRDEAREVFEALCDPSTGFVYSAQFRELTKAFALQLDADAYLDALDEDGDGKLALEEFRRLLEGVGVVTGASAFSSPRRSSNAHRRGQHLEDSDDEDFWWDEVCDGGKVAADQAVPGGSDVAACSTQGNATEALQEQLTHQPTPTGRRSLTQTPQEVALTLGRQHGSPTPRISLLAPPITSAAPHASFMNFRGNSTFAALARDAHAAAQNEAVTVLDAQMQAIRRDLSLRRDNPLEGIDAAVVHASYVALEPLERRKLVVRLKSKQSQSRKPAERPQVSSLTHDVQKSSPAKVVNTELRNTSLSPLRRVPPDAVSNKTSSPSPQKSTPSLDAASPSGKHRLLPPMLRPTRKPFRVEEGVVPSWVEPYSLYVKPF